MRPENLPWSGKFQPSPIGQPKYLMDNRNPSTPGHIFDWGWHYHKQLKDIAIHFVQQAEFPPEGRLQLSVLWLFTHVAMAPLIAWAAVQDKSEIIYLAQVLIRTRFFKWTMCPFFWGKFPLLTEPCNFLFIKRVHTPKLVLTQMRILYVELTA